jgi:hypothetical protein
MTRATLPTIERLLRFCAPFAIAGFVVPVVIDPIKSHPMWRLAHVSKEVFEGQPPLTYRDASASVVSPSPMFWIEAAFFHAAPAIIGRCLNTAGVAVRAAGNVAVTQLLAMEAAATAYLSLFHVAVVDYGFCSAVALADPESHGCSVRKPHGDKATEALASDIVESGHNGSSYERLRQEAARRFSGGPSRHYSTEST